MKYLVCLFCLLVPASCDAMALQREKVLSVLSWNVQNLFNDQREGGEYEEFIPSASWTTGDFYARCSALAYHLDLAGRPDVVVLLEIENSATARTLQTLFLWDLGYHYSYTEASAGFGIQSVIYSRHPILKTGYLQPLGDEGVSLRPILEAQILWEGRRVWIYANHWKSRREGEVTEAYRRRSAELLSQRLEDRGELVVLGDFNTSLDLPGDETGGAAAYLPSWLKNLWTRSDSPGSYWYRDSWQKLDHILYRGEGEVLEFRVFQGGTLADKSGRPYAWNSRYKKGISDHFPVMAQILFWDEDPKNASAPLDAK